MRELDLLFIRGLVTVAGADQKYQMTSGTYTGESSVYDLNSSLLTVCLVVLSFLRTVDGNHCVHE